MRSSALTACVVLVALAGCDLPQGGGPEGADQANDAKATAEAGPGQAGFLAALFGGAAGAEDGAAQGAAEADAQAPPDDAAEPDAAPRPQRGFFARLFGGPRGDTGGAQDLGDIEAGQPVAFGSMGRVCGREIAGSAVARYPADGQARYRILDTAPGSESSRPFYVTGFSDGCARQIEAAMVLFGDVGSYEAIRLGSPEGSLPTGATDARYDRIKRQVCGAGQRSPCGAALPDLAADTVFISAYPRFGSNTSWQTLLLHDGDVVAQDIKSTLD